MYYLKYIEESKVLMDRSEEQAHLGMSNKSLTYLQEHLDSL